MYVCRWLFLLSFLLMESLAFFVVGDEGVVALAASVLCPTGISLVVYCIVQWIE